MGSALQRTIPIVATAFYVVLRADVRRTPVVVWRAQTPIVEHRRSVPRRVAALKTTVRALQSGMRIAPLPKSVEVRALVSRSSGVACPKGVRATKGSTTDNEKSQLREELAFSFRSEKTSVDGVAAEAKINSGLSGCSGIQLEHDL